MLAVDFRQSVDSLIQQFWCAVRLAVPLGPFFSVLQTEVGREVDDLGACSQQFASQGMGYAVGSGKEHHIARTQSLRVRHTECEAVVVAAQVGIHVGNWQASLGSRSDDNHFSLRMLCQQTQQFDPGVTRAADNTDLDHNLPSTKPLESL